MGNTLVESTHKIDHPEWGRIHVHNTRPAAEETFGPERIIICQHGATYGSLAFSHPFNGLSFLGYLAHLGFDAYCLDLPGYGQSARPPQMDAPPQENPPFMRTSDASDCLGRVVDWVCERRGVDRVCLLGWSWGTAITSYFTTHHNGKVERLVLHAPIWDRSGSRTRSVIHVDGPLGAYRTVNKAQTRARRQGGLAPEHLDVMPIDWFDQWWAATAASDPASAGDTIRAPNGVVLDGDEYWNIGKPLYDPAALRVPVLVVVGEWDNDTPPALAQALFPLIVNAPWKRLTILSGGTHSMIMERRRMLLCRTVSQFLLETPATAESIA